MEGVLTMRYVLRGALVLLALAALVPAVTEAQLFGRRRCCHRCQLPTPQCSCPAVAPVPQTTYQPVVETQYAVQPELTYRDVVATEYRTEAVNENVPVTAYDNVTVDEGAYQTVWVPRPVAKQVARTVYQPQTSYRTVPYQATRRVAEYTTRTVPYQTVRYVPSTSPALAYTGTVPGITNAGVPAYTTTNTAQLSAYPWQPQVTAAPIYAASPAPIYTAAPAAAPLYTSAPPPVTASNGIGPVPDARFAQGASTPVLPRTASRDMMLDGYQPALSAPSTADRGPSLFVPAPSAAQVWRTPRGTTTR